ncbi:MAG: hypothetical protein U9R79_11010 [Armatimonadota bacterium]|nr:hypothetical protein [Armatimonadota bacterium]
MKRLVTILALLTAVALAHSVRAQDGGVARRLDEFGPVETVEEAEATLQAAVEELMEAGGGVLVIPPQVTQELEVRNVWQAERTTSDEGPVVTIMDYRGGFAEYHVAPIGKHQFGTWTGFRVERVLNLGQQSLPHCGTHGAQAIDNVLVSGATSYMHTLTEDVQAGEDVRCYVNTIRGVWVGAFLNITSSIMGYAEPYDRVIVKSIGWDPERRRNYFTCDLEHDHPAGALVYNKHNCNGLVINGMSNCDNQTAGELMVKRHNYAVGDSFGISGLFYYMSDIFSGFGDEGAVVLNAETIGELDGFHSTVESVSWENDELVYESGQCNAHTLSNSRPLINMNRDKWITEGTVKIVPSWEEYQGQSYPGVIGGYANAFNYQGGAIIGSAECPWDESVIGRFFCITDDSEVILPDDPSTCGGYGKLPSRPVYRWYRVMELERNEDGTKRIKILRVRWSAVAAGAPKLFDDENYTYDGHERPLHYAIAPGAWVYDISRGWAETHQTGGNLYWEHPRTLKLVPTGDRGTPFDFEPGDEIEQPVGPDPYHPRPLRIRQFDQLPSTMPTSSIEVQQKGRVQVPFGLHFDGIIKRSEDLERRKDRKPAYDSVIHINALANTGIEFRSEVMDSAIVFRQPDGHAQPIRWSHQGPTGGSSLTCDPASGNFVLQGGDVDVSGGAVKRVRGVSATETVSSNLRGIDMAVEAGATEATVSFPRGEMDARYAVSVTPSWLTTVAVPEKTSDGFTVQFGTPAPEGARIDWIMIR